MPVVPVVKILKKKSYLAMIRNAAYGENHMFCNLYALVDDQERDINENGNLACAFFVSSVLYINKLIGDMHAGTPGLERDLASSGWRQVSDARDGAVIFWEPHRGIFVPGIGNMHHHVGFSLGNGRAVSNAPDDGVPREHDMTYNDTRKVIRTWWHPELDEM